MTGTIWDDVLSRIETKVNRYTYFTWFRATSLAADSGHTLTIRVSDRMVVDWLTKHYLSVIQEALTEVGRPGVRVEFLPDGQEVPAVLQATSEPAPEELDLEVPDSDLAEDGVGLSPRYSFDTFIVGSSNQFAHAACRAVAEAPSRSYNPLFLYGGVGLGKTHLMHAIGHYVLRHSTGPEADVCLRRAFHERSRECHPVRPYSRVPRALPRRRCPARRRRAVHRRQGADADRVLPHVQRAARRAEADRAQQRLPAASDHRARGTAAKPLRMGLDCRSSSRRISRRKWRF